MVFKTWHDFDVEARKAWQHERDKENTPTNPPEMWRLAYAVRKIAALEARIDALEARERYRNNYNEDEYTNG